MIAFTEQPPPLLRSRQTFARLAHLTVLNSPAEGTFVSRLALKTRIKVIMPSRRENCWPGGTIQSIYRSSGSYEGTITRSRCCSQNTGRSMSVAAEACRAGYEIDCWFFSSDEATALNRAQFWTADLRSICRLRRFLCTDQYLVCSPGFVARVSNHWFGRRENDAQVRLS